MNDNPYYIKLLKLLRGEKTEPIYLGEIIDAKFIEEISNPKYLGEIVNYETRYYLLNPEYISTYWFKRIFKFKNKIYNVYLTITELHFTPTIRVIFDENGISQHNISSQILELWFNREYIRSLLEPVCEPETIFVNKISGKFINIMCR